MSPSAGLRYLFRPTSQIDPLLLRSAERVRVGDVVWDIGANVGLFTLSVFPKASMVVAVEPDEKVRRLLKRSCRNLPVEIVPRAVGESVGTRAFHLARRSTATNFLEGYGTTQTGGTREVVQVQTVTLDWLAERYALPDVLKIDVEGAECEVLKGCSFLSKKRPVIICEVGKPSVQPISDLLHKHDYQLYDETGPISLATWNTIAVPR